MLFEAHATSKLKCLKWPIGEIGSPDIASPVSSSDDTSIIYKFIQFSTNVSCLESALVKASWSFTPSQNGTFRTNTHTGGWLETAGLTAL